MTIRKPYLLFLGDVKTEPFAKTAFGLRDWCAQDCVGQWSLDGCAVDLGLPVLRPDEAVARGAKSMVIAVASIGGALPPHWEPSLIEALEAGLDLVNGMHSRLTDIPDIAGTARHLGRLLHDVRHAQQTFGVGTGRPRPGSRLLTVGTDCSLGKKYTALAIAAAMKSRGCNVDFRATGQTGIMIAGRGVAIDAVVADFIAGAAEWLSPDNMPNHWDIIEGQGSLFHPAYSGVTLGLLHGSQPDALVLCHDPSRTHINGYADFPIPSLTEAIDQFQRAAKLTNRSARFVGISLNTSKLDADDRARAVAAAEAETGLPAVDPLVHGVSAIIDNVLAAAE